MLSLLQLDDFPRRFVATVDNLGRSMAPLRLWPVNPMPGRLKVAERGGRMLLDADNGLRYTPLVLMLEAVPAERLAALYRRMYPLLQQAYADIGYRSNASMTGWSRWWTCCWPPPPSTDRSRCS